MADDFIAVIGGANMDLTGIATARTVDADSNPGKVTLSPGGVARNIAENLAHLGSRCELIAPLGDDLWGQQLITQGSALGIGMTHCLIAAGQRTSTYLSLHDQHGELSNALNDMAIIERLTPAVLQQRLPVLQQAACWVLDANLSTAALAFLFAQAAGKPIWVDPVSVVKAQKLLPHLQQISGMTPNLQEAAVLAQQTAHEMNNPAQPDYKTDTTAGRPGQHHVHEAPALATRLHQRGISNLMITLGEQGAYLSTQGDTHEQNKDGAANAVWLPAHATHIKNVTGCGDAASAALIHANNRGMDWHSSGKLAMAAAALTATCEQTNTPLLQTLANPT